MNIATVVVVVALYPWVAGRVVRHLMPPPGCEGRIGWGRWPSLACRGDGLRVFGFRDDACPACTARTRAKRIAWLWPLALVALPFVTIYRAGVGTEIAAKQHTPHDQPNELASHRSKR